MAVPEILPGGRWKVYRSTTPGVAGPWEFVCLATTKGLSQAHGYTEQMMHDCDQPNALPDRRSVKTSHSWSANLAGAAAPSHMEKIRADFNSGPAVGYRFISDPEGGVGAGYYQGLLHFENLEQNSADFGHVTFSVTARGDGPLVWTDGLPA